MIQHRIRLVGPGTKGVRISAAVLKDLLVFLVQGSQEALRLRMEGRSRAPGKPASWIEKAADFDLTGFESGSTQVVVEARSLRECAPEVFGQSHFFPELDPGRSGIDVLQESLRDALEAREDSELFDDGLISTFEDLDSVTSHGIERIELDGDRPLGVDHAALGRLGRLRKAIPPDQRVIVAGKLDLLKHSERIFMLDLEDGTSLRGVISSPDINLKNLGKLWGSQVRVAGTAKFRPSGRVLRVEAEEVVPADGNVALWSRTPNPVFAPLDDRKLRVPQGLKSGISAIFGQWPGDESEEEFSEALRKIS
ncbi:MAG: hypothetical protein HYY18_13125 [Planctomycetes bacterium]|nr:hypothetical protein [Planctomycetota bacterium]